MPASTHENVVLEADGGSRGNPGPAGFGALIRDADSGDVIAEAAESIGRATNNVAEYRGLIAGLELFNEHTPDATLEVRMDSKLVVRDAAAAELTAQQQQSRAERDKLAADIPADLLALYERLRAQLGGVGVGALHQKRCGGCQLNVGASELARFATAPTDEVLRCEECNRILVRTDESGL